MDLPNNYRQYRKTSKRTKGAQKKQAESIGVKVLKYMKL